MGFFRNKVASGDIRVCFDFGKESLEKLDEMKEKLSLPDRSSVLKIALEDLIIKIEIRRKTNDPEKS